MLTTFSKKQLKKEATVDSGQKNRAEKLPEIYREEGFDQLQKPQGGYGLVALSCFLAILFSLAAIFIYEGFFQKPVSSDSPGQRVIVDKQENITVTFEERLKSLGEQLAPMVVTFYRKPTEASGYFFETSESLGSGIILTNDGWLVTTKGLGNKLEEGKYVILTNNLKVYEPKSILKDPASDLVFVKIEGRDLPVAKLGEIKNIYSGQELYGLIGDYPRSKLASLHAAEVGVKSELGLVESTEKMSLAVFCQEGYDASLLGSPLVNLSGEVVAMINSQNEAVPIDYLKPIMDGVLKKNKIERTSLGVGYINLSSHPKLDLKSGEMLGRGALLSGYKNMTAIVKNSPAEKAGLKSGDIIVAVEDNALGTEESLSEIIQNYLPGQKIKMTIVRDGKEKGIEVTLGKAE